MGQKYKISQETDLKIGNSKLSESHLKIIDDSDDEKSKSFFVNWRNSKLESSNKKKNKKEGSLPPVSYFKLFRFASTWDLLWIGVALAAAMATGALMPLLIVLYGEFTNVLVDGALEASPNVTRQYNSNIFITFDEKGAPSSDDPDFMTAVATFGISCCGLGLLQMILDYIFVACLNFTSEKQILSIRQAYLRAVLRQDIGYYDTNQTGDFASRLTEDLKKLQDGINEKLGMFIFQLFSFIFSIVLAFLFGWKLTLVVLSSMPLLIASTALVTKMQASLTERELKAYASAGAVCEEVLTAVRTVMAFGGEEKETKRYAQNLIPARKTAMKRGVYTGIGNGVMWCVTFASYALAFWYGVTLVLESRLMEEPEYTPGSMAIVFFCVLYAATVIGQAAPYLEAFSMARGAAAMIFSVIDRTPQIDSLSEKGLKPSSIMGEIKFLGVNFSYPSRKEVPVLKGLDLKVNRGETVALVGTSGCGKSTCLQLVQRFYDPDEGLIEVDEVDIKELNISWLRSNIGVVGQEPVLFDATIAENIRYGNPNATFEEIRFAAKESQADDFIMKLPSKYDTLVGDRGAQLSGGQKQRIAIARALVKKPAILLLDEATSALDTSSEAQVQQALDQASNGRTTIVVAHRLSTVKGVDRIVVFEGGKVVEEGTHNDLMAKGGAYYNLVATQTEHQASDQSILSEAVKREENEVDEKERKAIAFSRQESILENNKEEGTLGYPIEGDPEDVEAPVLAILKLNKREWKEITFGCIGAFIVGCSMPVFAVLFGDVYGVLSLPNPEDVREGTDYFSLMFLLVGVVTGVGAYLQMDMLNRAGVKMTMRLREECFAAMLRQEIAWFDDPKNSTGALCARLSGDAASVQGATGSRVGTAVQTFATLALGLGLALFFSWKLGLVTAAFVPIVFFAVYLEARILRMQNAFAKTSLERASKVATEAIGNIRTVAGLVRERAVIEEYSNLLKAPHAKAMRTAHIRGLVFGFGQTMPFFAYGISLYYGGWLVHYEKLPYENIIKVTEALIYGTMMLGQALAFAPDFNQAKVAANKIMRLLARQPKIFHTSHDPLSEKSAAIGDVNYNNVEFAYPSRPNVRVLGGMSLQVKPGQTVALVGASGCGKSTCLQLLQRLYDPLSGTIKLDEMEVSNLPITRLRAQLGVVSQEPVLFDRSLAENIKYGDNAREVSMGEVLEAAKQANIHNFISSLPNGYETRLGERGAQLSGGQKQRVAIARALVRNPRVLLLDEATSALDAESEKVVQATLDDARRGRTCITIAHRLSTIRDSDMICVVEKGRVVESGTHSQLLALNGAYRRLHAFQEG
ncbi:ATP-dependent translocase ABCB1-like [Neocloeon triangulifer]|uniref:ATP-dependent translocase ABCB1-like n=1 Tax=Neocloeon triangulifer TaxID=2078957 RepID=UPI00286ED6AD|nr:ATP-dependent translocase ABCB1-like [Neocloeon triangulifer]XP_059477637.1 ATP-dependent translocase ABCB1-like [Neocloeon triangulifer]XP_059477638.1 ATP-dependent translocase ABCB1-like [Neocloeon triangulifer]